MTKTFKPSQTLGLFSEDFRLEKLSKLGDPLERLNKIIQWDFFRDTANKTLHSNKLVHSGAKPFDPLLMFKILILQRYYNLGDDNLEYQILDRLTFCRFLGLSTNDKVPDAKTVWAFREKFVRMGLEEEAFSQFNALLEKNGLIAQEGKIIDASFVEAPRQRNTREENAQIKEGQVPEQWHENPHKKRQKDTDAKWTKKNDELHFGYKNHAKVDNKYKFIDGYTTSNAAVHDSQELDHLLGDKDHGQDLYADSAYTGEKQQRTITLHHMNNQVHEKGTRNNPLNQQQKQANRDKSKIRARVEHVFGFMEQSMGRLSIRTIGMARAKGFVGLVNLTYNLFRYEQVNRINKITMPEWY